MNRVLLIDHADRTAPFRQHELDRADPIQHRPGTSMPRKAQTMNWDLMRPM